MKQHLIELLGAALESLRADGSLARELKAPIALERTRQKSHGDFACNLALTLGKQAGIAPRQLAQQLVDALPDSNQVQKTEIAGPGFINFFLTADAYHNVVQQVLQQGEKYGRSDYGRKQAVLIEFVSANPTGPLHVGHGRGAAYGATLANLLDAIGFQVHREYYVNDAGRQMDILATSVWLRYLELCGETIAFPRNGYQGDYIWDIAADIHRARGDDLRHDANKVFEGIPADEGQAGGDKEAHIDGLIARAKTLLADDAYAMVLQQGLDAILGDIRKDLEQFGVHYDQWFSERSLMLGGAVERAIETLRQAGHLYQNGGAVWFRSSKFGDEKDRVVVRENGQHTYFASDIAYHMHKLERGYHRLIDIWGADHHGYVARIKAVIQALGSDADKLDVLLVQFAILYRGGKKLQMSTRSGKFVTLRELRKEVGNDAARFFYVLRKSEQHMDFDLDLAKSESNDNPVYYIQYAHARVCSVYRKLEELGLTHVAEHGTKHLVLLKEEHELDLMATLSRYPEVVQTAALNEDPHQLAHYLRELANDFHTYYNAHKFINDAAELRDARLALIGAVRQVIANGLNLLGVSAPENM